MKQLWIIGISVIMFSASAAIGADAPAGSPQAAPASTSQSAPGHRGHWPSAPKTRQEAIEKLQKRLDKLKSMTDEQWQQQRDARQAHYKNRHSHGSLSPASGNAPSQAPQQ